MTKYIILLILGILAIVLAWKDITDCLDSSAPAHSKIKGLITLLVAPIGITVSLVPIIQILK